MSESDLRNLTETALTTWIQQRMSGAASDPPVNKERFETPSDFLIGVYARADDVFKQRCELAIVAVLRWCASAPDLRDSTAAKTLAGVADASARLELRATVPDLLVILERGFLGTHGQDAVDSGAYEAVLAALVLLQSPGILRDCWLTLWGHTESRWAALATAGLRRCDPDAAVELLPEVVRRADQDPSLPLGEILWAYQADPYIGPARLKAGLGSLTAPQIELCRNALCQAGATPLEIAQCVPA